MNPNNIFSQILDEDIQSKIDIGNAEFQEKRKAEAKVAAEKAAKEVQEAAAQFERTAAEPLRSFKSVDKKSTEIPKSKKIETVGSNSKAKIINKAEDVAKKNTSTKINPLASESVEKAIKKSSDYLKAGVKTTSNYISDLNNKLMETADWGRTAGLVAVGIIGVASVVDTANKYSQKSEQRKQERIQEKNLRRKTDRALEDRYLGMGGPVPSNADFVQPSSNVGLVQSLFGNRTGHSNTWGGTRY